MTQRDIATVAFRLLALWVTISAVTALVDLLFNWQTVAAQVMGSFSDVTNPPTRQGLLWMSASAFVGRGVIGIVAWWLSPLLARVTLPPTTVDTALDRRDLYSAASFLVGLWLIASSAPGLAFEGYVATRPGRPAYPEAHSPVPLLFAQLVLGIAFIRGRWLVNWASSATREDGESAGASAVQQRDEADEARDG